MLIIAFDSVIYFYLSTYQSTILSLRKTHLTTACINIYSTYHTYIYLYIFNTYIYIYIYIYIYSQFIQFIYNSIFYNNSFNNQENEINNKDIILRFDLYFRRNYIKLYKKDIYLHFICLMPKLHALKHVLRRTILDISLKFLCRYFKGDLKYFKY